MQAETRLIFWWLNILNKKRYDVLVERCGSLDEALKKLTPDLLRATGMRDDAVRKAFVRLEEFDPTAEIALLEKADVELVGLDDDAYPRLLKETSDPPPIFSYRGDLTILSRPCIALVGTRSMTSYGQRLAEMLAPDMVRAGCTTVSGLALGIDAVVGRETIRHGGKTVAVLGSGLGVIAPRTNLRLAEDIVKSGGLLVSEYPYGEPPQPHTFPPRNRIIAGLSHATVVIEAPAESGALITARSALEENREVLACPGPLYNPSTEGCNKLIAEGTAQLLRVSDDVLRAIGVIQPTSGGGFIPANDDEELLYGILTTMPSTMDDLVEKSGKSAAELGSVLTMLELARGAKKVGNGWVRN